MASLSPDTDPRTEGLPISVCVPATRAETVGATIGAIRRQTWTDWELIVLGQGAADVLEPAVSLAADAGHRLPEERSLVQRRRDDGYEGGHAHSGPNPVTYGSYGPIVNRAGCVPSQKRCRTGR